MQTALLDRFAGYESAVRFSLEVSLDSPNGMFARLRAVACRYYHDGGSENAAVLTAHLAELSPGRKHLVHAAEEYKALSAGLVGWAAESAPPEATHLLTLDEVLSHERGNGLGLVLAAAVLEHFGAGRKIFAALEPCPMATGPVADDNLAAAREALGRHWAKLGFEHRPGSGHFMGRDISDYRAGV